MSSNDKENTLTSQDTKTDHENSRALFDKQPDPDGQSNCSTFAESITGCKSQTGLTNPEKETKHETEQNITAAHTISHADPSTKNPHPDEEAKLNTRNHYDAGWAWVVCGTTFLMEFFVGGMITSSGVIYAALLGEFKKSRSETGMIMLYICTTVLFGTPFQIRLHLKCTTSQVSLFIATFHSTNSSISNVFNGLKKTTGSRCSIEIMISNNLFSL